MYKLFTALVAVSLSACASMQKPVEKKMEPAKVMAQSEMDAIHVAYDCSNKEDLRSIVSKKEKDGCKVSYEKFKKAEVIGHAHRDMSFCEGLVTKVKTNLETGGFACKARERKISSMEKTPQ